MNHVKSSLLILLRSLSILIPLLCVSLIAAQNAHALSHAAMVKDINGSPAGSLNFNPGQPAVLNGFIYFPADDGIHGFELWRSDGTEAGTTLIKDINPGSAPSYPRSFVVANGRLFFSAIDGVHGEELWVSDGTEAGTFMLKDLVPGSAGSEPLGTALAIGNTLYFLSDDSGFMPQLWKSDGTEAGTVKVKDFPLATSMPYGLPPAMTNVNDTLFFNVLTTRFTGELWKSDGTETGTILVKEFDGPLTGVTSCNGLLFCPVAVGNATFNLWKSDGTTAGTIAVSDLPISGGLACLNSTLYFAINDPATGIELWRSDGSATGTTLVSDVNPGSSSSAPDYIIADNGAILFTPVTPESGRELWKSDGTAAGTVMLKDITPGVAGTNFFTFTEAGGKVFFLNGVPNSNDYGLWLTDGSASGTMFVQNFDTRNANSFYQPQGFISLGNKILFNASDKDHGSELWALSLAPAPFTTITTPTNSAQLPGTTVSISGIAQSDTGAGIQMIEVSIDGGATWNQATGTDSWNYTWSAPGNGTYTIKARATDLQGAVESPGHEIQVTIDTTPPSCVITSPTANSQFTTGSVYVTGTASDNTGLQRVEVSLDNGASWKTVTMDSSGNWQYNASFATDGSYTILARGVDLAGNHGNNASVQITIATIPWGTVVINDNVPSSASSLVNLTMDATDGVTTCVPAYPSICGTLSMQLSSDGSMWGTWQEATTAIPWLLKGNKVCARFRNAAGNISAPVCDTIQVTNQSVRLTYAAMDSYFSTISDAYNNALAGDVIYFKSGNFPENLTLNRALAVILSGSYNDLYQYTSGTSTLYGDLTVASDALVTVGNLQVAGTVTVTSGTLKVSNLSIL